MKTFIMLGLALTAFTLNAQIVVSGDYQPQRSFISETVSFPNLDECEQVEIQCKTPGLLTDLEFRSQDTQIARAWSKDDNQASSLPMKMTLKPGKIQVRFKMQGGCWKTLNYELEKGKPLCIVLDAAGVCANG